MGNIAAKASGAGEPAADHIDIAPGKSTKLDVVSELEEGFNGQVAIEVENLPPGVQALPAAGTGEPLSSAPGEAFEVRGTFHKERYRPVRLKTSIVLVAGKDAVPSSALQFVRLGARAISGDKIGPTFSFQEIPLMVTSASSSAPEAKMVAGTAAQRTDQN